MRVHRGRVLAVLLAGAGAVVPVNPAAAAEPWTESETVRALVPYVRLHPEETWFPMNPGDFIKGSRLRFDQSFRDKQLADAGQVDPGRLGGAPGFQPYEHDGHFSNEARTKNTDGFFLELDPDDPRKGTGTTAATLYRFDRYKTIEFWLFYGYSDSEDPFNHEGDWERIAIQLRSDNRPTGRVAFYGHNGVCTTAWSDVSKVSGRPVVYSSLGDHASFPRPGIRSVAGVGNDRWADGGEQWDPAAHGFYNLERRPWYGYTGAWGEIGNSNETTGPQGPGAKPLDPAAFAKEECKAFGGG